MAAAAASAAGRLVRKAPPAQCRVGDPLACRRLASEGEWAQRGAASAPSGG